MAKKTTPIPTSNMTDSKPNDGRKVSGQAKDQKRGIATSNQPFHFVNDMAGIMQNYNDKTAHFVSDRLNDDLATAGKMLSCRNYRDVLEQSKGWWHRMGQDYLSHVSDTLAFSTDVKAEIDDLAESEAEIAEAKPEALFENTPV